MNSQTPESPIRSRVAPDINPAGGGIVDDGQAGECSHVTSLTAADTSPGASSAEPSLTDKISGYAKVAQGKVMNNPEDVELGKAKAQGTEPRV